MNQSLASVASYVADAIAFVVAIYLFVGLAELKRRIRCWRSKKDRD